MRGFPVLALVLVAACSGEEDDGPLTVWPQEIYLGLTPDGYKFAGPVGASGGTGLVWTTTPADSPRVRVSGTDGDNGGTVHAVAPGAGQLTVRSAEGESVTLEVLVTNYASGSVERGQMIVNRLGCQNAGCHDATGPNITSSRILGFPDAELTDWIVRGRSLKTGQTVPNHMWDIRIDEEQDVVSYLRSLAPRGTAIKR